MKAAAERGNAFQSRYQRTETEAEFTQRMPHASRGTSTGLLRRGLTHASGAFAIIAFTGCAVLPDAHAAPLTQAAQQAPAGAAEPSAPPVITYVDGQLRIKALNVSLAEVLAKVASLTGVKFDVPPSANGELMPFVELGPGTAREVLADLLSESGFDYLLAASETDPDKIQSVLLMPRGKTAGKGNRMDAAARPQRGPYGRPSPAEAEAAMAPENSIQPAQAGNAAPDAAQPNSPPADPSTQAPVLQPGQSNVPRTAPVPVPSSLDSQSINSQLQQMYQQRVQMNQQMHQAPPPNATAGPPNN